MGEGKVLKITDLGMSRGTNEVYVQMTSGWQSSLLLHESLRLPQMYGHMELFCGRLVLLVSCVQQRYCRTENVWTHQNFTIIIYSSHPTGI